jgi:hypothetical protein
MQRRACTATGYRVGGRLAFLLTLIVFVFLTCCLCILFSSGAAIHDIVYDSNSNITVVVSVEDKAGSIDVIKHTAPPSVTIVIPYKPGVRPENVAKLEVDKTVSGASSENSTNANKTSSESSTTNETKEPTTDHPQAGAGAYRSADLLPKSPEFEDNNSSASSGTGEKEPELSAKLPPDNPVIDNPTSDSSVLETRINPAAYDAAMTKNISAAVEAVAVSSSPKVVCVAVPFFGRNFNRIIQLGNALSIAGEDGNVVGLDERWSNWYKSFHDQRDDILLYYNGTCVSTWKPITLHLRKSMDALRGEIESLIPKASIRAEAEAALADFGGPVTTVHRRHLEGGCVGLAQKKKVVCIHPAARQNLTVSELVDICNMDYGNIVHQTNGTTVVLFTDGQVGHLDQTFPHISKHSFQVQTWMMARSQVHYGNPMSTVDMIVAMWRRGLASGDMMPKLCYDPSY